MHYGSGSGIFPQGKEQREYRKRESAAIHGGKEIKELPVFDASDILYRLSRPVVFGRYLGAELRYYHHHRVVAGLRPHYLKV